MGLRPHPPQVVLTHHYVIGGTLISTETQREGECQLAIRYLFNKHYIIIIQSLVHNIYYEYPLVGSMASP